MTHVHPHPVHAHPLPGSHTRPLNPIFSSMNDGSASIPGRSSLVPQVAHPSVQASARLASLRKLGDRFVATVAKASSNNADAVHLAQHFLPAIQQFESDFPGSSLAAAKLAQVPNHHLNFLDNACRHQPPAKQGQARMDVAAMRQLDQELAGFGLQIRHSVLMSSEDDAYLGTRR